MLGDPVEALVVDDLVAEPAHDPVIGPELAAARHRVGLSVDELADRTRIRPHVIEAIEVDDFAPCGGDFYARGHIRTLARMLGKDPAPMLEAFEARYATAPVNARRVFEAELATGMTGTRRNAPGGPNWALLVAAVLVLVLLWSAVRLFAGDPGVTLQTPPPLLNGSSGLGHGYGPTAPAATTPVPTTVKAVTAGVHVRVRDGEGALVYEGDLAMGQSKRLRVRPPVTVAADDGAALAVRIAGEDRGFVGTAPSAARKLYHRPQR
jgi:cytoskeleton protein RodZ